MDDRTWYLSLAILGAAVLAIMLDAGLPAFDVPPGFYPFLGIFAGVGLGRGIARTLRQQREDKTDEPA